MTTATKNWQIGETTAPLPPKVPGLPILGNALALGMNPIRFAVEAYHKFGPIYRLKLLNREVVVMAGLEANQFTTQHDEEVFTNEIDFGWVKKELGPLFTAMPNDEHRYMRRMLRPMYARSAVQDQAATLAKVVDDFVAGLKPGQSFEVFPAMQEIVVNQLGLTMFGYPVGEYFEDVRNFMLTCLQVYQFQTHSPRKLKSAAFAKAKARAFELGRNVLAHLQQLPPDQRRKTSIDLLMENKNFQGQPFSDEVILAEAIGPYLAGQDTVAGTMTFILYTLHKYQEVLARVTEEIKREYTADLTDANDFRKFEALHKTIVETMRLYPVATFMPRHAAKTFEFAGHRVEAGMAVYSATSVTHFLPEFYPDPFTFNIDRGRGPSSTYVPYGVGNYACLGAGIADVQLMVTTAALLRRGRFELDPLNYEAKISAIPLPNPGKYRLKLVEKYA